MLQRYLITRLFMSANNNLITSLAGNSSGTSFVSVSFLGSKEKTMSIILTWALPVLFVSMLSWTIWMWRRLENAQRWIAIIPLVIIFYVIVR